MKNSEIREPLSSGDLRCSVLTLVRGRQDQLNQLIRGLSMQTDGRFELVIAYMQESPPVVSSSLDFPVSVVQVVGEPMPLAAARNAAAANASTPHLIFLDVDCIPGATLVESYNQALTERDGCFMGEVRYLPHIDDLSSYSFDDLAIMARTHPARPDIKDSVPTAEPNPRMLWGLSFALRKSTFDRCGGLDENFVGYGGEETDFALSLEAGGVKFYWCPAALALHQHHAFFKPPLDKLEQIVSNAQRFRQKWNSWCMEYWLLQFVNAGLIEWLPTGETISILRLPTSAEIECSRLPAESCWS